MISVRLHPLPLAALVALDAGDPEAATDVSGIALGPFLVSPALDWLWPIRIAQITRDPEAERWVSAAVVDDTAGTVVGHAGFHGPPDAEGLVEIGYSIDPAHQRRGYGQGTVAALIERATAEPDVRTVRATIAPDNAASLATIAPFGFEHRGQQVDEVDGPEDIFERAVSGRG